MHRSHRAGPPVSNVKRKRVHGDLPSLVLLLDRALWATPPVTTHMLITHVEASHFACHTPAAHTPHSHTPAPRSHVAPLFTDARLSSQTLSSTTRGQERSCLSSHQKAEPRIVVSHQQTHCGQLPIPHHRNPTVHADAGTYSSLAIVSPSSIAGLITCICST